MRLNSNEIQYIINKTVKFLKESNTKIPSWVNEVSVRHLDKFASNNVDWNAESAFYDLTSQSFTIPELLEYLNDLSNRFNSNGLYKTGDDINVEDELPEELKNKIIEVNKSLGELYKQVLAFATRRKETSDRVISNYNSKRETLMQSALKKWKKLGYATRRDYMGRERPDWTGISSEQEEEFFNMLTPDESYTVETL